MKRTVILFVAMLLMAGNAMAGRTYVLIAGVSNYSDTSANLSTTTSVCKDLQRVMEQHSNDVSLLTSRYANHDKIMEMLNRIAQAANADDRIIFFFSGHGSEGCLVPYDLKPLYYTEVIDALSQSKAREKMVFVEACMSGSAIENVPQDWREKLAQSGTVFILSSRADEYSYGQELLKAGWFSHAFMKAIRGMADKDADRNITVMELFTYVYNDVVNRSKNTQHPQLIATKEHRNDVVVAW